MKNTLTQWKRARKDFLKTISAAEAMMEASKRHRSEVLLDTEVVAAILAAFAQGKPLCCEKGLTTLYEIGLDECWVLYLNNWAYECLGCDDTYRPGGSYYEQSLKKLHRKLKEGV